jgi:hypothetical protein
MLLPVLDLPAVRADLQLALVDNLRGVCHNVLGGGGGGVILEYATGQYSS